MYVPSIAIGRPFLLYVSGVNHMFNAFAVIGIIDAEDRLELYNHDSTIKPVTTKKEPRKMG
jgi:hypothetical protein